MKKIVTTLALSVITFSSVCAAGGGSGEVVAPQFDADGNYIRDYSHLESGLTETKKTKIKSLYENYISRGGSKEDLKKLLEYKEKTVASLSIDSRRIEIRKEAYNYVIWLINE